MFNHGQSKTFPAYAAYAVGTLVKLRSDGQVEATAATDTAIGSLDRASLVAGQPVSVRSLKNGGMSHQLVADGTAIAVGDKVYQAAAGKVGTTSSGGALAVGISNTASTVTTGAGDGIEVIPA